MLGNINGHLSEQGGGGGSVRERDAEVSERILCLKFYPMYQCMNPQTEGVFFSQKGRDLIALKNVVSLLGIQK